MIRNWKKVIIILYVSDLLMTDWLIIVLTSLECDLFYSKIFSLFDNNILLYFTKDNFLFVKDNFQFGSQNTYVKKLELNTIISISLNGWTANIIMRFIKVSELKSKSSYIRIQNWYF